MKRRLVLGALGLVLVASVSACGSSVTAQEHKCAAEMMQDYGTAGPGPACKGLTQAQFNQATVDEANMIENQGNG